MLMLFSVPRPPSCPPCPPCPPCGRGQHGHYRWACRDYTFQVHMYLTWLQESLAVTWSPSTRSPSTQSPSTRSPSTRSPSPAAWAVGVLEALPDYNDRSTDPDARRTDARTEDNGFLLPRLQHLVADSAGPGTRDLQGGYNIKLPIWNYCAKFLQQIVIF
jgi:hypothetical protein